MSRSQEIVTPCPACGARSLFIGEGGHLTCGVIGCKDPSVESAVEKMQREIRVGDALIHNRDLVLDALRCPAHGRCVPFALQEIVRLKHPHPTEGT